MLPHRHITDADGNGNGNDAAHASGNGEGGNGETRLTRAASTIPYYKADRGSGPLRARLSMSAVVVFALDLCTSFPVTCLGQALTSGIVPGKAKVDSPITLYALWGVLPLLCCIATLGVLARIRRLNEADDPVRGADLAIAGALVSGCSGAIGLCAAHFLNTVGS